jgi:serine/threonine protein kinase
MSEDTLFHEALARPPAERAAFLEAACAGQPQLRAAVEALLAAHERSGHVLDQPLQAPCQSADPAQAPDRPPATGADTPDPAAAPAPALTTDYQPQIEPGAVIAGRYTLVEKIGEGGMGEVWVAKQTEPVKRKVALKLIKAGMDTRAVLQRFEAERQALALMDHPHIAKVFDGGITAQRRPFFVMELVSGLPLTRFCDDAKFGVRERLELFVAICQAVQHAHQKGIIHRDLKPSNILVTIIDGRGVPKVIDFGVAKATSGRLTEESLSTQFGAVIGTFEYMSPEQAGYSGADIDTRADIYSLGVILYELLTGLRPLDAKRLRQAALTEMVRIIKEEEPSKPSTRISTDASAPSLAALRQTEPKKLMAMLRGELDWVVMKCLEKQRDRRYETANGLARDIQRYLADEVVEARPPSAGYRLRKFARKHRAALASATAIAALLVAGLSVSLWQMSRAIAAEGQANQNAQQAQHEANAKAEALKAEQQARADETKARRQAFAALRSMTADVVERKFAQGAVLTEDDRAFLRGVIAQFDAFAAIQGDDADSRAVRAEGRYRVGNMRFRLGELREAEKDYDQALSLYQQLAADFPSREFRQGMAASHFSRANLLRGTGRLREAEKEYDHALSLYRPVVAEFPSRPELRQALASSHLGRGLVLLHTGRFKEAEQTYDEALRMQRQLAADFPARPQFRQALAKSHTNRGNLLRDTGRLKEAERDYDQAVRIFKQLAADFPSRPELRQDLAKSHENRGTLRLATGRPHDAEKDYDQTLSIRKQLAADFPSLPDFRWELAGSYSSRGTLRKDTFRLEEAEKDYDQALSLCKQLAADSPSRPEFRQELARSHCNRGNLLRDTGRPEEAEKDYDQAVGVQKQLVTDFPSRPTFRHQLALAYLNRGLLLSTAGRLQDAEKDRNEAVRICKQLVADFPSQPKFRQKLALSYLNRGGGLLSAAGRLQDAEKDLNEALRLCKQLVAEFPNQPDRRNELAGACVNLAILQQQRGDWAAAKRLLLEGQPHHLVALKANPRHPSYRQFYHNHLHHLTGVHAGLLEQADAVHTAEIRRDLGWDPPADAYDAACFLSRSVTIVAKHEMLNATQRQEAARFYGDAAMRLLREAVSKGYKDVAHLKEDTDLNPLRQREDFRKLVAAMERKAK